MFVCWLVKWGLSEASLQFVVQNTKLALNCCYWELHCFGSFLKRYQDCSKDTHTNQTTHFPHAVTVLLKGIFLFYLFSFTCCCRIHSVSEFGNFTVLSGFQVFWGKNTLKVKLDYSHLPKTKKTYLTHRRTVSSVLLLTVNTFLKATPSSSLHHQIFYISGNGLFVANRR